MAESKPAKTPQLDHWKNEFGNDYADRNAFEEWRMTPGTEAFRRMLQKCQPESMLEIGCNVGLNLIFLKALLGDKTKLYGIEPNSKAFAILTHHPQVKLESAWNCDAFQVPLPNGAIELVFTSGVLIHIAPNDLGRATDEIVRVAKRYVLCAEYFSHTPREVPYHSQMGLLFKRDFGAFYLDRYPNLKCIDYGFLWQREYAVWDNVNWWLLEKH